VSHSLERVSDVNAVTPAVPSRSSVNSWCWRDTSSCRPGARRPPRNADTERRAEGATPVVTFFGPGLSPFFSRQGNSRLDNTFRWRHRSAPRGASLALVSCGPAGPCGTRRL